jgi:hypothetical protein
MISFRMGCGAHTLMLRSPSNSGLQLAWHAAQAAQRSYTPVMSSGGMYAPIAKYWSSPVTSWNVGRLGEMMVMASNSKS